MLEDLHKPLLASAPNIPLSNLNKKTSITSNEIMGKDRNIQELDTSFETQEDSPVERLSDREYIQSFDSSICIKDKGYHFYSDTNQPSCRGNLQGKVPYKVLHHIPNPH